MVKLPVSLHSAHEVLDQVLGRGDAQALGLRMHLSPQMIRHWCRAPETEEEYQNTGRPSPLQRLDEIIEFVILADGRADRAHPIGRHVAAKLGGVFFPLPPGSSALDSEAARSICAALKECAEAIEEVRKDWFDDGPGCFSSPQIRRIDKEVTEALAALLALRRFAEEHRL